MPAIRLRDAALALVVSALSALPAAAQSGATQSGASRWVQGVIEYRPSVSRAPDVTVCESANHVGSLNQSCYVKGVQRAGNVGSALTAASVGPDGALHAGAYVDWYQADPGISVARAYATALFSDRLTFGAVVPASLEFALTLHGSVVGSASYGELSLNGPGNLGDGFLHLGPNDGGLKVGRFTVGVWGGSYDFTLALVAFAQGSGLAAGHSTRADFLSTAFVSGLRALDASGQDITAAVIASGVTSASGVTYGGFVGGAVTTTPEPASLALLGGGVLLLGAAFRSRRERAAAT